MPFSDEFGGGAIERPIAGEDSAVCSKRVSGVCFRERFGDGVRHGGAAGISMLDDACGGLIELGDE